jgi:hypothetical protein
MNDPVSVLGRHSHQLQPVPCPIRTDHDQPLLTVLFDLNSRTALRKACRMSASAIPFLNADSVTSPVNPKMTSPRPSTSG